MQCIDKVVDDPVVQIPQVQVSEKTVEISQLQGVEKIVETRETQMIQSIQTSEISDTAPVGAKTMDLEPVPGPSHRRGEA